MQNGAELAVFHNGRYLETFSAAAETRLRYIHRHRRHNSAYFQDALKGNETRYYAFGFTTKEGGYYFVHKRQRYAVNKEN